MESGERRPPEGEAGCAQFHAGVRFRDKTGLAGQLGSVTEPRASWRKKQGQNQTS